MRHRRCSASGRPFYPPAGPDPLTATGASTSNPTDSPLSAAVAFGLAIEKPHRYSDLGESGDPGTAIRARVRTGRCDLRQAHGDDRLRSRLDCAPGTTF